MLNKERKDCKDAWIDENDIEHNPAYGPGTDEEINGHWVGEFAMIFEYGEKFKIRFLQHAVRFHKTTPTSFQFAIMHTVKCQYWFSVVQVLVILVD